MYHELNKRFSESAIGQIDNNSFDILTGTHGALAIASIYEIPARYNEDQWPTSEHKYLSENEIEKLEPPDLDLNPFFQSLMEQVDWIGEHEGKITGFMNWQGVLNNAQRLRGQNIFTDMYQAPERTRHLLDCVCTTMIDASKRLQAKQKTYESSLSFFTLSNCLVNMIEPELYENFLLPLDQKIADSFDVIGVHNCAWCATPYLTHYAKIQRVAYIDMGIDSDLENARKLFPDTRRAIMYPPTDVANKPLTHIRADLEKIAMQYGPCDIVAADIEADTSDNRVLDFINLCNQISNKFS
jgi:uroporphyrinogen-III decarboxylase